MKTFTKRTKVFGMTLVMCVVLLAGCGSTQGIPHGTYHSLDENGDCVNRGLEYGWQIREGEAEYLYLTYNFVKEDDLIYFYYEGNESTAERKYKVAYDKDTKILSVFMPSNIMSDESYSTDVIEAKFKKPNLLS